VLLVQRVRPFLVLVTVGQDSLAVRQLSFEVWINYLADLKLLAILFNLLQGLERRYL